jgi:DNA-3-methyladenine glycosylase
VYDEQAEGDGYRVLVSRFQEFADRYRAELKGSAALAELQVCQHEHPVITLVYSAKDPEHNQAVVLCDLLMS